MFDASGMTNERSLESFMCLLLLLLFFFQISISSIDFSLLVYIYIYIQKICFPFFSLVMIFIYYDIK